MSHDVTVPVVCRAIEHMELEDVLAVGKAVAMRIRNLTPDAPARQRILQQMDLVEELSIDMLNRTAVVTGERIFDFFAKKVKKLEARVTKHIKALSETAETPNNPDPSHEQSESH
jgi:BMFP domain-containing protein YqiC